MKLTAWIGYPGSFIQHSYAEELDHGYLAWNIDVTKRSHSVDFVVLPNPKPFVTLDWSGTVEQTIVSARAWPSRSRFRIRSSYPLASTDVRSLTEKLVAELQASEVVFAPEDPTSSTKAQSTNRMVDGVDSFDILSRMLREYYDAARLDDRTWDGMLSCLSAARESVIAKRGEQKSVVWSIKSLQFDGLYSYGDGNYLDFESKNGIIGVLGPNAIGKSSIVGALMYVLFNSSDRDAKNVNIVNVNKSRCYAKAVVTIGGIDYEITRETNKTNKNGIISSSTLLELSRFDGNALVSLKGEQRSDTEKTLRELIGTCDDFSLTCVSTQDDVARFLREGPTQRKVILSKFLGLDFFDLLHKEIAESVTELRSSLKSVSSSDELKASLDAARTDRETFEKRIRELSHEKEILEIRMRELTTRLAVTRPSVESFRGIALNKETNRDLLTRQAEIDDELRAIVERVKDLRISEVELSDELNLLPTWDVLDAKKTTASAARMAEQVAKAKLDSATRELDSAKRVSLKLADVPCGDAYPNCVYIRDAHEARNALSKLAAVMDDAIRDRAAAAEAINGVLEHELEEHKRTRLSLEAKLVEISNQKKKMNARTRLLNEERLTLQPALFSPTVEPCSEIELSLYESESEEYVSIERTLREKETQLRQLERDVGRSEAIASQLQTALLSRTIVDEKLKIRELLANAFSRRGIPNRVLSLALPALNAEMDKVLVGTAPFRVKIEALDDVSTLDIYIEDGNSKRYLELGSGMEKTIASLALRVALCNLTRLPRPDFLVLDEGFGSLDESNAVACVSLLRTLKQWFKFILVISHIDIIKEAVDCSVNVVKTSQGSSVQA